MFKDLKFDFPAVLAMLVVLSFVNILVVSVFVPTAKFDESLKQTLVSIVMLMVGFYFGSSKDSQKKTDAMIANPPSQPPAVPAQPSA